MDKIVLNNYGIDYDSAVERFMGNQKLYERLLKEFIIENEFTKAAEALEKKEYEKAYSFIHSMKGITGNLSINRLYEKCCKVVEVLVKKEYEKVSESFDSLMRSYEEACRGIIKASED